MHSHKGLKAAFLTRYDTRRGSSRFRVYSYIPHLEKLGWACRIIPFPDRVSMKTKTGFVHQAMSAAFWADVVVLQKLVLREGFFNLLKRANKNLVFDMDDAIYTPADSLADDPRAQGRYEIIRRRLHHTLGGVRSVIAGNAYLADYAGRFAGTVNVLPTSVDTADYTPQPVSQDKSPVVIGWIGSRENLFDFQPVKDALNRVLKKLGDRARLKIVSAETLALEDAEVIFEPWSLEKEKDALYSFDIGLMPLKDTERTRGRCAFKAILYMAAGIPVIASPVGAAVEVVEHEKSGILAAAPAEWTAWIERLVSDPKLRSSLGAAGRQRAEEKYSIRVNAGKLSGILK
jgi:glycosyltransferase involved in cell wall biosynthesis